MIKQLVVLSSTVMVAVGVMAQTTGTAWADERTSRLALDREAVELVERIDEAGREIRFHADRLSDLSTFADVSPWSHYSHLDGIKRIANEQLRPALLRLAALQATLPGWKQDSIDRMMASARQMTAATSAAYFKKDTRPSRPAPINPEYRQLVQSLSAHAGDLVAAAHAAHAYAVGHLKAAGAGFMAH
jgi:hypothetical protein